MNKDLILERIKTLETEQEQVKATLSAYSGALQESRYWLDQINKTEVKD